MENGLLLNAFPGAGKTRNVLRKIHELGKNFVYLGPEHEVIEENVTMHDDVEFNFIHFKSRERECENQEYKELAQQYGISLRPLCDLVCNDKETCPYYVKKKLIEARNPPSWAGVHSHIITYLKKYMMGTATERGHLPDFDVLVLEESPIPRLMENRDLSLEDIGKIEQEAAQMEDCHEDQLGHFCDMLEYFAAHTTIPHDYERLWRRSETWRQWPTAEWAKFNDKWEEHITLRVTGARGLEPLRAVPKNVIMLWNDIFQTTTREKLESHVQNINNRASFSYFYGNTLHNLPIRIIGLDGTADPETWRRILGREITMVQIAKPFKNVYQLKSGNYPQSSWLYEGQLRDTGLALLRLVEKIVKSRDGRVLLIGTKKIAEVTNGYFKEKNLDRKIVVAHYYSLRSKNFLNCDTVVLLVRPSPPQNSIETYSALSEWPAEVWHNYYTREEMLQALARIRPNLEFEVTDRSVFPAEKRKRKNIEMFVLCNIGRRGEPAELFRDNDILEGTYHRENMATIDNYITTGLLIPYTRNEIKMEAIMLDFIQVPRTEKEVFEHMQTWKKSVTKRKVRGLLERMTYLNKLRMEDEKYELVRRLNNQDEG